MTAFNFMILAALCLVALAIQSCWNRTRRLLHHRIRASRRAVARQSLMIADYPAITADLETDLAVAAYDACARAELRQVGAICEPTPFELLSSDEKNAWIIAARYHLGRL